MTEKYELTESQENRFAELEGIIERGQKSFLEVGAALIEIKNSKLYQNTHGTFEAYCKQRWGFSYRQGKHLIDAVNVMENLENMNPGSEKPEHEKHARPLAKLPPEKQPEAWAKAVETAPSGKVTAKHVESVVDDMINDEDLDNHKPTATNQKPKEVARHSLMDLNKDIQKDFNINDAFKEAFDAMLNAIEKAFSGGWKDMSKEAVLNHLDTINNLINRR